MRKNGLLVMAMLVSLGSSDAWAEDLFNSFARNQSDWEQMTVWEKRVYARGMLDGFRTMVILNRIYPPQMADTVVTCQNAKGHATADLAAKLLDEHYTTIGSDTDPSTALISLWSNGCAALISQFVKE